MSRRVTFWLTVFAVSTIVGLYFATQAYSNPIARELGITWTKALQVNMTYYYLAGALVPIVILLARRFRLDSRRWAVPLAVHLLASVLLSAAIIIATETILKYGLGLRAYSLAETLSLAFQANFHGLMPAYWFILAGYYGFDYYAKFRDRELRASQLETRLSDARMQALRMQLQPHFLFNTLHSISSLMYSNVEAADQMITHLGDFLRMSLETDGKHEITLDQELEFVRRYFAIEQIRFEDRLKVHYEIDPGVRSALVPSLVLQPIVENAIRHGIEPLPGGGRIAIVARKENGSLRIEVSNDGAGFDTTGEVRQPGTSADSGVGLANTRARLSELYGDAGQLSIQNRAEGGVGVTISIPWRSP